MRLMCQLLASTVHLFGNHLSTFNIPKISKTGLKASDAFSFAKPLWVLLGLE